MTRDEQIRQASIDYQLSTDPRAIGGDAFADFAREMNVNPSFIAGAKWADKTMVENACEWLKDNANYYLDWYDWEQCLVNKDELLYDFRKAMNGGEV